MNSARSSGAPRPAERSATRLLSFAQHSSLAIGDCAPVDKVKGYR